MTGRGAGEPDGCDQNECGGDGSPCFPPIDRPTYRQCLHVGHDGNDVIMLHLQTYEVPGVVRGDPRTEVMHTFSR
jgi:hypothetical protein